MVGEFVQHSRFGRGEIIEYAAPHIKIRFESGEKRFAYPQAFESFLSFESAAMQARLNQDLESVHEAERAKQAAQAEAAKAKEAKAKRAAAARKAAATRASRKIAIKA